MKSLLRISLLIVLLILSINLVNSAISSDELHNIKVKDIFISEDQLSCPKHLSIIVQVQNDGENDENVFVELSNEKISLVEVSQIFNIKPDSIEVATFDLDLPAGIEGEQEFEAAVFFNKESGRMFQTFNFKECLKEEPPVQDLTNLEPPQNNPVPEDYSISAQVIFVIAMLIIIFILAVLYIIKIYLEKK